VFEETIARGFLLGRGTKSAFNPFDRSLAIRRSRVNCSFVVSTTTSYWESLPAYTSEGIEKTRCLHG